MILPTLLGVLAVAGTQQATLPHMSFENDEGGWAVYQPLGTGASLAVTHDAKFVRTGKGSLAFSYKVEKGQLGIVAHHIEPGTLAPMNSIHFWMQSDHDTTMIVSAQEHNGGRYSANIHATKGKWQEVQLGVSDFLPATEADAPKDPDGKLDTDQIETIIVGDVAELMFQNPTFAAALKIAAGDHKWYMSDFSFSDAKLPDTSPNGPSGFRFDTFTRPQVAWAGFGKVEFAIAKDSPFPGNWLKMNYKVDANAFYGALRAIKVGSLAGAKMLSIELGAVRPAQLLVQLEAVNGSKFFAFVEVPGLAKSKTFDISLTNMQLTEDSPDKSAKLDLSTIKQLILVDVSAQALGSSGEDNTLYIGSIVAHA